MRAGGGIVACAAGALDLCAQPNLFCATLEDDNLSNTLVSDDFISPGSVLEAVKGSVHASAAPLSASAAGANGASDETHQALEIAPRNGVPFVATTKNTVLRPRIAIIGPNPPTPTLDVLTDHVIVTALP